MDWFAYMSAVAVGWHTLALGVLGLNELSEHFVGKSWKWLHAHRWKFAVVYLLLAQALAYRDLANASSRPQAPSPVVAENPDHARLGERLERIDEELRQERDKRESAEEGRKEAESARNAALARAQRLETQANSGKARAAQCDKLAELSTSSGGLIQKLRATRAAPETRREIDQWYRQVCDALSGPQCAAFTGAPPASGSWVAYPAEDGGYSQTLRGRAAFLSQQLASNCR